MNNVRTLKYIIVTLVATNLILLLCLSSEMDYNTAQKQEIVGVQIKCDSLQNHLDYCKKYMLENNYFNF